MGMILTDLSRNLAGEYHYRKALELHQPVGKLCANLGLNLRNQGKLDEAEKYYRMAMELEPDNITSLLGWVKVEEARRDFDRAWELLHQVEALAPEMMNWQSCVRPCTVVPRNMTRHSRSWRKLKPESTKTSWGPACFLSLAGHWTSSDAMTRPLLPTTRPTGKSSRAARGAYNEEVPRKQAVRLKRFFNRKRLQILPRATTTYRLSLTPVYHRLSAFRHDHDRTNPHGPSCHLCRG